MTSSSRWAAAAGAAPRLDLKPARRLSRCAGCGTGRAGSSWCGASTTAPSRSSNGSALDRVLSARTWHGPLRHLVAALVARRGSPPFRADTLTQGVGGIFTAMSSSSIRCATRPQARAPPRMSIRPVMAALLAGIVASLPVGAGRGRAVRLRRARPGATVPWPWRRRSALAAIFLVSAAAVAARTYNPFTSILPVGIWPRTWNARRKGRRQAAAGRPRAGRPLRRRHWRSPCRGHPLHLHRAGQAPGENRHGAPLPEPAPVEHRSCAVRPTPGSTTTSGSATRSPRRSAWSTTRSSVSSSTPDVVLGQAPWLFYAWHYIITAKKFSNAGGSPPPPRTSCSTGRPSSRNAVTGSRGGVSATCSSSRRRSSTIYPELLPAALQPVAAETRIDQLCRGWRRIRRSS